MGRAIGTNFEISAVLFLGLMISGRAPANPCKKTTMVRPSSKRGRDTKAHPSRWVVDGRKSKDNFMLAEG